MKKDNIYFLMGVGPWIPTVSLQSLTNGIFDSS